MRFSVVDTRPFMPKDETIFDFPARRLVTIRLDVLGIDNELACAFNIPLAVVRNRMTPKRYLCRSLVFVRTRTATPR